MRRALWACAALALGLRAEPRLLTYDAAGRLLGESGAVLRREGRVLVGREALKGAERALVLDDRGAMHTVVWVTGEDSDAGVVELFVGLQAPAGPAEAGGLGTKARAAGHEARVRPAREAGVFGQVARLECGKVAGHASGPLYDEHGRVSGWHAVRVVEGETLSFAIPLARFDALLAQRHEPLGDWNRRTAWTREEAYQKGLGYEWVEDFEGALYYFRKAVDEEPANGRAWLHLGFAEGKTGHTKAKMECYRQAVEKEPGYAPAHYYLGFGLLLQGQRDGALAEWEKLRKLDAGWAERLKLFLDAAHVDVLDKGHAHAEHRL